jgi:hypothetical protein
MSPLAGASTSFVTLTGKELAEELSEALGGLA